MNYQKFDPATKSWVFDSEAASQAFTEAEVKEGIVRWKSNNTIPPKDILEDWKRLGFPFDFGKSIRVGETESMKAMDDYIQFREENGYSQEEKNEIKAAFGNKKVIDILTGKEI